MEGERIEFYNSPQGKVFVMETGKQYELTEKRYDVIERLLETIEDNYNDAYKCLETIYKKSKPNASFYKYKIVHRFLRCNCGEMDTLRWDIDNLGNIHLEQVRCPLRGTGDCEYENILCMPQKTTTIKGRQLQIAEKLADGLNNQEIADAFFISIHTVHNIIQQIKSKIGVKNTGQIVTWYNTNYND